MFIPREKMTGIHPLGSLPIMDEEKADACACETAGTRFRKEMIMTSFDWLAGFDNPLDIDFKDQKGNGSRIGTGWEASSATNGTCNLDDLDSDYPANRTFLKLLPDQSTNINPDGQVDSGQFCLMMCLQR